MFDYSKMFDLSGRRALVIGGASGIGQASALGLAAHGAEVVVADVNVALAEETAQEIKKGGGKAATMKIDMRDKASIEAAAQSLGALDALVVTPSINVRKPLLDLTDEEFDRVVDLNLKGVFRVLRAFAPAMAARGKGSIVAFSSVRAQVVEPGQGVYAATKAGTLQMIRALAAELGTSGVRLNAVAPGVVETPLTKQIIENEAWYRAYADKSMLKRWASPAEMAGAVVFLCSDASSYVTGSYLLVDGGWTAADGRFTPPLPKRAN
ncbi:MAG: SDR family NAD(P)-dependent oxidoreductase [Roseiarcus sp.]|jgi:NAD(P)-dependent dehydrogenase (short-subunit alcohol dehydrogenase family)